MNSGKNNRDEDVDASSSRKDGVSEESCTDEESTLDEILAANLRRSGDTEPDRRLKDYHTARVLRRRKFGSLLPVGIFGLFLYSADIRADIAWAKDAAYRRVHKMPYVSWGKHHDAQTKTKRCPIFSYLLIIVCSILLVLSFAKNEWKAEPLRRNWTFGPSAETLVALGALSTTKIMEGQWYRIFIAIVLHAGVIHWFLNMACLLCIGPPVERIHGSIKTGCIFVASAAAANVCSAIFSPLLPSVGASGGIFALIGMCLFDSLQHWRLFSIQDEFADGFPYKSALFWLIIEILITVAIGLTPWIDNFGHLGGLYYGFCFSAVLLKPAGGSEFLSGATEHKARQSWNLASRTILFSLAASLCIYTSVILHQTDNIADFPCEECRYISCVPMPFWKENKWWECDPCSQKLTFVEMMVNGSFAVNMNCPYGDVAFIDLSTGVELTDFRQNTADYCRIHCDL